MYFGWTPPKDKLFGKKWTIIKENDIFKLIKGKDVREITEKDIINAVYWKNADGGYISGKDLPDFITWEGFCWLATTCLSCNVLVRTDGTVPIFTKDYFIQFRDVLYDLLKEKENV